jgi:hypothetical protein
MKITPVGFVARRRTEIINQPNSSLKKLSKPLQNDIHALWKLFNSTNGPHWEWCSVKYGQIWIFLQKILILVVHWQLPVQTQYSRWSGFECEPHEDRTKAPKFQGSAQRSKLEKVSGISDETGSSSFDSDRRSCNSHFPNNSTKDFIE